MPNSDLRLYANYHSWKSWSRMFVATHDQAMYFEKEFSELRIKGADVLEIGFGSGDCAAWMVEHGARVSMTELNEESCAAARREGFEVISAELPEISQTYAERFDTILALDVFEHLQLEECRRYLGACAVMLRPGGKLLLRFPNSQSPFGLAPQMGDPTHRSFLSGSVLQLLISDLPFEFLKYRGSALYCGKLLTATWVKRTARLILQRLMSSFLRFVYASGIPYDPVVVVVLAKRPQSS